ncbi:MAG: DUF3341 domain-containing protein [bacterium]|nr:DUF3341 domain-containing protein [bacterium]
MADATARATQVINEPRSIAMLVEFADVNALMEASRRVRDAGFNKWDAHTPYPVHGLNEAMGLKPTILHWIVLGAGLSGFAGAVLLQWWMNAYDYPYIVSGKPFWSIPANVPIMFELTVLFAGITTFLGQFFFNKLPTFYHPVFHSARFEQRAMTDRFYISIESEDPLYDGARTARFLQELPGQTFFEELMA